MLNMRPFQIVLISVFALLALVGLYVFSNFSGGSSGPQVGTVIIWGTLPAQAMNDAIGTLRASQKQYANVSYTQIPAASFDSDLANALAAGTGPDLIVLNQEQLLTEAPKLTLIPFSSIPKRTFIGTYLSVDQMYLTADGTYGIPLVVDPLVLYYNRKLLSGAGVPLPPTAWQDVAGLVSKTTQQQSGSQTISVSTIPFGSYGNVTNARAILSLLFLQAGTSIITTNTAGEHSILGDTSVVSPTTGRTPAEDAVYFYTLFANSNSEQTYTWNQSLKNSDFVFESGDLLFYPGFASESAGIKAANPNLDFDMAPIPQADTNAGGTRITYGLAYAFGIPKVSKNQSGAYNAALALTGSSVLPSLALELGMAPAQGALLKVDPSNAQTAVYYPEALNVQGWLSPAPAAVDAVFSAIISSVTSGKYDMRTALSHADQSLNADF